MIFANTASNIIIFKSELFFHRKFIFIKNKAGLYDYECLAAGTDPGDKQCRNDFTHYEDRLWATIEMNIFFINAEDLIRFLKKFL